MWEREIVAARINIAGAVIEVQGPAHDTLDETEDAAMTAEQAQQAAADMARRYGCRVYVLGVVGIVECPAKEPQWVRPVSTAVAA